MESEQVQSRGMTAVSPARVGVQTVFVNSAFVEQNGELILDAPHGLPIRRAVTTQ
jgi:hypothetical protein